MKQIGDGNARRRVERGAGGSVAREYQVSRQGPTQYGC